MEKVFRLENWGLLSNADMYTAPELIRFQLIGTVSGHPNFPDGKKIITSYIKELLPNFNIRCISGSIYELGEPDPEYERLYPNSKDRLLTSMQQQGWGG